MTTRRQPRLAYYGIYKPPGTALPGDNGDNGAGVYSRHQPDILDDDDETEDIPNQELSQAPSESEDEVPLPQRRLPPQKLQLEPQQGFLEALMQPLAWAYRYVMHALGFIAALALLFDAHVLAYVRYAATTIYYNKTYRYGLAALLVAIVLFFLLPHIMPTEEGTTISPPPVSYPHAVLSELPLYVEVYVKQLVEQQLSKRSDDLLARLMQKVAADNEELRLKTADDVKRAFDAKAKQFEASLPKTALPSLEDAPELKALEAKFEQELKRLNQILEAEKKSSDGINIDLKGQLSDLQRQIKRILETDVPVKAGAPRFDETTQDELNKLKQQLHDLISSSHTLEKKVETQTTSVDSSLRQIAEQFNSVATVKDDIDQLKKGLSALKVPTVDEQALQEKIFTKWNSEKEELIRTLRQATDKVPGEAQLSPEEIVSRQREVILGWVDTAVGKEVSVLREALQSISDRLDAPVSAETSVKIVEGAREIIHKWIEDQQAAYLEAAKASLIPELNERIVSGEAQFEKQIQNLKQNVKDLTSDQERQDKILSVQKALDETTKSADIPLTEADLKKIALHLQDNKLIQVSGLTEKQVLALITKEIQKFAADRLNMTDWALGSAGGRIISKYTSDRYHGGFYSYLVGQVGEPPSTLLTPHLAPGNCWAFAGHVGNATIQLPVPVKLQSFSLDHISSGIALDVRSAPQDFKVWGFEDKSKLADQGNAVLLGQYKYDIYGTEVQTFLAQAKSDKVFQVVKLGVQTNHGHPDYTCIYRFRVHGTSGQAA